MSGTVFPKEERVVELKDGWKAKIVRPEQWVTLRWYSEIQNKAPSAGEQGRDEQANDSSPALDWSKVKVWMEEVYPHVVLGFITPSGEEKKREEVWLSDLGFTRLWELMGECGKFVNEADQFFRDDEQSDVGEPAVLDSKASGSSRKKSG